MKYIVVLILVVTFTFGMKVTHHQWKEGRTFSEYIESHNIPVSFLNSISKEDQKFLEEIQRHYKYYELKDENDQLIQALIPLSKEMQVHIFKYASKEGYGFDIIPVEYKSAHYFAKVNIQNNPYTDTLNKVQDANIAKRISRAIEGAIDAKKLRKNDEIAFNYIQRTRLGKPFAMPNIKIVKVRNGKKSQFIYVDEEGYGYTQVGQSVAYTVKDKKKIIYTRRVPVRGQKARFGMPLRHIRVTSGFSYKRFHPILKRYRPHHGTDFGARKGTPLLAVNSGKVIFSGWMGGYGKVIKIRHAAGYVSLYAHQSRLRAKRGQRVKKGQIIGYVGSTGRSTGPHLHFGLKKNGRWVNPMRVLRKKSALKTVLKQFTKYKETKTIKYKKIEIEGIKENKEKLLAYLKNDTPSYIWGNYK
ncbi:MAG: peptidoglycan DD-metalloendopeptidase family protein [Campylobacterota bacterium]|nr:peptidoglycan DD-metalloendopeptidase family protein [Campylobacterota bacterium]